jgi:hypothetical protein
MVVPSVGSGIEKRDCDAGYGVNGRRFIGLRVIAPIAGIGKVLLDGFTPFTGWQDVFDLKKAGCEINRCFAIFAAMSGTFSYQLAQFDWYFLLRHKQEGLGFQVVSSIF